MRSSFKWILAIGAGVAGGWAIRSLSDSPEGAGVKLLEIGIKTKDKVAGWAAVERERLDDMLAEAHANIAREDAAAHPAGHEADGAYKRPARLIKREGTHNAPLA
ncbi:MAG TPA: hypothetical protein VMG40_17395 [Bryobacteraceae bacterium]|jgi:hypothetical protein|nr:hypothetical protein [Bryobacteraceae bacterium]